MSDLFSLVNRFAQMPIHPPQTPYLKDGNTSPNGNIESKSKSTTGILINGLSQRSIHSPQASSLMDGNTSLLAKRYHRARGHFDQIHAQTTLRCHGEHRCLSRFVDIAIRHEDKQGFIRPSSPTRLRNDLPQPKHPSRTRKMDEWGDDGKKEGTIGQSDNSGNRRHSSNVLLHIR
jgi:hypothetical protein